MTGRTSRECWSPLSESEHTGPRRVQTCRHLLERNPIPLQGTNLREPGGDMVYIATRKTVAYGGSTYVVLDKSWGIKPGELIQIQVDRVDRGSEAEEGPEGTPGLRGCVLGRGQGRSALQARRPRHHRLHRRAVHGHRGQDPYRKALSASVPPCPRDHRGGRDVGLRQVRIRPRRSHRRGETAGRVPQKPAKVPRTFSNLFPSSTSSISEMDHGPFRVIQGIIYPICIRMY